MGNLITGPGLRRGLKRGLAAVDRAGQRAASASGATVLIYHRVQGATLDERNLPTRESEAQVDALSRQRVVSLDAPLDELAAGDDSPKVVLTFDDGFAEVYANAWSLQRETGLPFTLYVTTRYLDGTMHWPGSTSQHSGPALSWTQLEEELATSPLVTIGNHTHTHARPEDLTAEEPDRCSEFLEQRLEIVPEHYCFTWGIPVPQTSDLLAARFRSAATGTVGRNTPATDPMLLHRVPVRGTDPLPFFEAKLRGGLGAERTYNRIVATAKRLGAGPSRASREGP